MNGKFRLPNITAPTDAGKLEQIRSYLYQLAEQLNRPTALASVAAAQAESTDQLHRLFARLRPLIARSGEICEAFRQRLQGTFGQVAKLSWQAQTALTVQSCFDTYDAVDDSQNFLVFGMLSGKAVQQTLVLRRSGTLLTTGTLPVAVTQDGKFTLTGRAGDSLTVLSDRSFQILEN